jgi:hypothetical protein
MNTLILLAAIATTLPTSAAEIYRCGNTYTDKPCGRLVMITDDRPTDVDRTAAITRYYEGKLYLQALEYRQREFELTKAYIQSPHITQSTSVTSISGASAGSSSGLPIKH